MVPTGLLSKVDSGYCRADIDVFGGMKGDFQAMRMVFGLVLVVGFALAGFAVYMVQGYLDQTQQRAEALASERQKIGELVQIYAVNKPLKYGDVLTKEDVRAIYLQKEFLPEGTFSDAEILFPKDAKPRFVIRQLDKFEPILKSKVTEPGETAGLTSRLAPGKRAFAIKVDVTSGVSGFLKPDDLVDVYWTGNAGVENTEFTQLIESSVKIIAVDQNENSDALGAQVARTVTVEVTPQQVARLAQAQNTGRLNLSLVGAASEETVAVDNVDTNKLLGIAEEVQLEAPAPEKVCTIRERKGAEFVERETECPPGQ
jgi:pilus assembly protein CpaB